MRPKIVAGNWKMNGDHAFVHEYLAGFKQQLAEKNSNQQVVKMILVPPAILIGAVKNKAQELDLEAVVEISAQNVSEFESGAYTGEISASMLKSAGCKWSLVGHSERRSLFGDNADVVIKKLQQLFLLDIRPILCVGETLEQRESGQAEATVQQQLEDVLSTFNVDELEKMVLAYEPVWAIGTGKTASPDEAQEMHKFIRSLLAVKSTELAEKMAILYGGSVNAGNAQNLFAQPDIDGGLVGGASLNPEEFVEIVSQAQQS